MNTITPLQTARRDLVREYARSAIDDGDGFLPQEADDQLNNASRRLVAAMHATTGQAWLGKMNRSREERACEESPLTKWDEGPIYNFAADFVLPRYDAEVERLMLVRETGEYSAQRDAARIKQVFERVALLGGETLIWS
jgi:hypothetical protein